MAIVVALVICAVFLNGEALGITAQARTMGYEDRLFDTGRVHTIDIVIDDWEGFLSTAQSEEYSVCSVVIDGEAFRNVGIRGKGNTSLSNVASMDSDRYSFKIEFDQYDSTHSYYGLDKVSLNNLIQDNTMMKDYLTYRMMNEFGVPAPLCSYAWITVNGEDWGLYLAVEAVEESFLQRSYGSDYGEVYKPDSMDMGGGRGNGKDFTFEDFMGGAEAEASADFAMPSGRDQGGKMQPGGGAVFSPENSDFAQGGGFMGNSGMGSEVTKLQYIDDQISSYAAIFDSAKTDITTADQNRLIVSLKQLSEGTNLESVLAIEDVIRYFVVHNYVVNGDSYTGSMIHNYYLYEQDGRLSMIPWDYNLAFGTFQGGSANSSVNDDIDSPLSVTGSDRPMIDWIFADETYTAQYHQLFQEFLDTVDVQTMIAEAQELITPYVEQDPTKFCTYEEFEQGVETLAAFCDLRSQSISAQLASETASIDASSITLSDMGTMSMGMGGGRGQMPEGMEMPEGMTFPHGMEMPEGMQMPAGDNTENPQNGAAAEPTQNGQSGFPLGNFPAGNRPDSAMTQSGNSWILLRISVVVLAAALLFAFKFKR